MGEKCCCALQRHCVVESQVREKYSNRVRFIIENYKRVFDELQIAAGAEKPQRQQHIHNDHAQKLHYHERGVANFKNVTHTEGFKHKQKVSGAEGYHAIPKFGNTPSMNCNTIEKCTLALAWHTIVLYNH